MMTPVQERIAAQVSEIKRQALATSAAPTGDELLERRLVAVLTSLLEELHLTLSRCSN